MYKVAIVEDQNFIANTIARTIESTSNDFFICGIYSNGHDCLNDIEISKPHIVLTDIKMPIMDGISLSEQLVTRFPHMKIIILTGYEDFDYARTALKLGISNYLLKPCPPPELMKALEKVAAQIAAEKAKNTVVNNYYENFMASMPTLRKQTITSLMYRDNYSSTLELISLYLENLSYEYILWGIDIDFPEEENSHINAELLLSCCCNIFQELLETITDKKIFTYNNQMFLVCPLVNFSHAEISMMLEAACETVKEVIKHNIHVHEVNFTDFVLKQNQDCTDDLSTVHSHSVLKSAIQYIDHNYHKDISLQDVANSVYISYNYLSTLFTQSLGVNFTVYLSEIRIEKACELLRDSELRISDISKQVGYNNYRYFNHVFKKLIGYTPTEYRRNISNIV